MSQGDYQENSTAQNSSGPRLELCFVGRHHLSGGRWIVLFKK